MFEQLCEFMLSTVLVYLASRDPQYALGFVALLCLIASVISLFIKEELRVDQAELEELETGTSQSGKSLALKKQTSVQRESVLTSTQRSIYTDGE